MASVEPWSRCGTQASITIARRAAPGEVPGGATRTPSRERSVALWNRRGRRVRLTLGGDQLGANGGVVVLVLVLVLFPLSVVWDVFWSVVLANATPLMPNATAMAEATSVFFIKPPTVE